MTPEERFLAELPRVRQTIAAICRRHGVFGDDAEEFASWALLRFIESDYAVFSKFEERSSLATYLRVVVTNLFLDYRNAQWGKWRPSAVAKRFGREAVELEKLVMRDGIRPREAVTMLRENGQADSSEDRLLTIAALLPVRGRPRRDESKELESLAVVAADPDPREHQERSALAERAGSVLGQALEALADEDRFILRLRFATGRKIADIAAILGVPAKALYPRLEKLLRGLRKDLETAGIGSDDVASIYEDAYLEVPIDFAAGIAALEQKDARI